MSMEEPKRRGSVYTPFPLHIKQKLLWLPDSARNMGIHLMAGRGSGKSRLMGRGIAWQDFIRGAPLVILDPAGPTIDNLLDKVARLPEDEQETLLPRILHVDMSGKNERVVPFPLYYRLGDDESIHEISQRFLDVVRSSDPSLMNTPMLGWNAVKHIGTYVGMVLATLGYQITEAEDLLTHPQQWAGRLDRAAKLNPDCARPVAFLTGDYMRMDKREREMQTKAFLNKIADFSLDRRHLVMFGADTPGVNWWKVVKNHQAVLLDFRRVTDPDERRLKMLWVFHYFFTFIKYRGAGRHTPISFIIDELANLSHTQIKGESPFAKALDELINVYARNCMVWLTLAHQELFQIEASIQPGLMSLGTQILGVTSDRNAALAMAKQLFAFDPDKVKRYDPIYGSFMGMPDVIDTRPVTLTPQEQQEVGSNEFTSKRLFEFLVRPAAAEGDIPGELYSTTIKNMDKNQWPDKTRITALKRKLTSITGVPVEDILSQIATRQSDILPPPAHETNNIRPEIPDDEEDYLTEERD
jgi:hypothetical protein